MKVNKMIGVLSLLFCGACDPVTLAAGGAVVVGVTAVRNRKGATGSVSDTWLRAKINKVLFDEDRDLFDMVELSIKHGTVIVIGYVKDDSQRDKIMQIVRNIDEVEEAYDEIQVQKFPCASDFVNDLSITSRIKSSLIFDGNISSLNYDITTVKGIVYICGTAKTKYERDVLLNHARSTSGVKKVISYVKINTKNGKISAG
ncbi:MAG: BON domain-containing protein [Holosporaceae bacterium]|jgi:osmotically-inducible protein OsmY|nr:BON domain-containing protein [Holosporaceae bacterium]